MVQPTTTRLVVSALQKFADICEYIDGTEKFTVDSITVQPSLDTQAQLWRDAKRRIVLDPHGKLPTNVLSEPDKIAVLNEAMNGSNWKDMTLSFTMCEQTFVQCDSMCKLNLCDLRTMNLSVHPRQHRTYTLKPRESSSIYVSKCWYIKT